MPGQRRRLDQSLVLRGLAANRSQADSLVRMGKVMVNRQVASKSGILVGDTDSIKLLTSDQYVSRAGFKLASIADRLALSFNDKVVLDVGSSTGGFTDYALQHSAKLVVGVDVGTNQLDAKLRLDPRVELHEKTDIRDFSTTHSFDLIVIDVSFISLRQILPAVAKLSTKNTQIVAMVKPQFEAGKHQTNGGVLKNDRVRRDVLKDFEVWAQAAFVILNKADSAVAGSKGNVERFYLLKKRA